MGTWKRWVPFGVQVPSEESGEPLCPILFGNLLLEFTSLLKSCPNALLGKQGCKWDLRAGNCDASVAFWEVPDWPGRCYKGWQAMQTGKGGYQKFLWSFAEIPIVSPPSHFTACPLSLSAWATVLLYFTCFASCLVPSDSFSPLKTGLGVHSHQALLVSRWFRNGWAYCQWPLGRVQQWHGSGLPIYPKVQQPPGGKGRSHALGSLRHKIIEYTITGNNVQFEFSFLADGLQLLTLAALE